MTANRREFLAGLATLATTLPFRSMKAVSRFTSNRAVSNLGASAPRVATDPLADPQKGGTRIILLGTKGGPSVGSTGRSNAATLILINNTPYVVDCGYGVSRQLIAAGISLERLRYLFITHHHSFHNLEYGLLFYNAWITGRPVRVDAYGPEGLRKLTEDFFNYQKFDIETRIVDEGRPDPRRLITVHEFSQAGMVMRNEDVKVTSCRVLQPPITQAYAYRFDTP